MPLVAVKAIRLLANRNCASRPQTRCLRGPRTDTVEAAGSDPDHEAFRRPRRREGAVGPEVIDHDPAQEARCPAVDNGRAALDGEVVREAGSRRALGLDGQRDAGVTPHVLDLAVLAEVPAHDLVAIDGDVD